MRISLTMNGRKTGYVHEVKLKGMRSQSGDFLQNDFGYYTLNRIPGGGETTASLTAAQAASESSSTKHITSMPSAWGKPDQVINVGTIPGMKYDVAEIKVKAGSKVQLNFNNNDDMQHNLLIVEPGRADELAQAAIDMGISGPNQSFVPQSDKVLFHTILLEPESAETIYFIAPEKSGTYQFVCTMPGHAVSMKGVFLVNP
ncbi:MAG: plastocyanin/azurin family copper-binding protein [Bacteroidota bacterium]